MLVKGATAGGSQSEGGFYAECGMQTDSHRLLCHHEVVMSSIENRGVVQSFKAGQNGDREM